MTEPLSPSKKNDFAAGGRDRFSPPLTDLIATVRDFMKDASARRDGGLGYDGQVARYLLDMSVRELELGADLDRHCADRIGALLRLGPPPQTGEPVELLCRRIRAGELDDHWEQALQTLLDDAAERVAIIRPDVLATEHTRTPEGPEVHSI